jgi:hypothetical protein
MNSDTSHQNTYLRSSSIACRKIVGGTLNLRDSSFSFGVSSSSGVLSGPHKSFMFPANAIDINKLFRERRYVFDRPIALRNL